MNLAATTVVFASWKLQRIEPAASKIPSLAYLTEHWKLSEAKEGNFESTLAELELVVAELEGGELALADQLKSFERGMALSDRCKKMLDSARLKVLELTEQQGENTK